MLGKYLRKVAQGHVGWLKAGDGTREAGEVMDDLCRANEQLEARLERAKKIIKERHKRDTSNCGCEFCVDEC